MVSRFALLSQRRDHVSESQETQVDGDALFVPDPRRHSLLRSLRTCQIDQVKLGNDTERGVKTLDQVL